ncbi:hypothetical protein BS47DRAFT_1366377 [Hydnum rufescens UP504]|uniref:Uncharacterized protein n=1 Tax=Hydnum rufescens UP504 TaxID=1448309 RepID=A0A9P6DRP9_9AGAM|nr:hypothetical protein BS47DRAFT_1366377 [Hydnum rufescens UP504]
MALRKKHKHAQNLGAYSQRRNLNLAQPPTPPLPYLPPLYHIDQFWSTPAIQNILDDVDLVHMAPTTEDMFKTHLFDAQKTLEKLSNVCSHISGHRVKYSGATLNGKHAIWTQYLDQRKKKNLDHQIEEMKRKTAYDHKKRAINHYFSPKCNITSSAPAPAIDTDLLDVGFDNPGFSEMPRVQTQPPDVNNSIPSLPISSPQLPTLSPMMGDGTDSEEGLNGPDRTTHSICPFISAPKREDAAVAAAQLEKVVRPPRNKGAGHKDPGLDLPSQM